MGKPVSDREWRKRLAALRDELDAADARGRDEARPVALDQAAVGRLSRMDAMQVQQMALAEQQRRDVMRRRIAAAEKRLDDGEFGYCAGCGEDIAPGRLAADPTTPQCIDCATGAGGKEAGR
ncbi:MAG: TraR/DksA C4-type zinc finger protein [Alphaproteobacteria bacterium]